MRLRAQRQQNLKKENFKELEKTKEYMETFYFKSTIKEDTGDYI